MTREEFSAALAGLGLSKPADAAAALGITARHVYYLAAGRSPVPAHVARVLACLEALEALSAPWRTNPDISGQGLTNPDKSVKNLTTSKSPENPAARPGSPGERSDRAPPDFLKARREPSAPGRRALFAPGATPP